MDNLFTTELFKAIVNKLTAGMVLLCLIFFGSIYFFQKFTVPFHNEGYYFIVMCVWLFMSFAIQGAILYVYIKDVGDERNNRTSGSNFELGQNK